VHPDVKEAYDSALKVADTSWRSKNDALNICLEDVAKRETEYESMVAFVTKEMDESSSVSKAALKEMVKGDARVIEAKGKFLLQKNRVKAIEASIDFVKATYHLEKKRMEAEMLEIQYKGVK